MYLCPVLLYTADVCRYGEVVRHLSIGTFVILISSETVQRINTKFVEKVPTHQIPQALFSKFHIFKFFILNTGPTISGTKISPTAKGLSI